MKIIKNTAVYSVLSLGQKAIGFFLLPVYTYFLAPEEYGLISVVTTLTAISSLIILLSLHGTITKFYFEYADDEHRLKRFIGSISTMVLILSVVLGGLLLLFQSSGVLNISGGVPFFPYLLLGSLTAISTPIYTIYQTILQTRQDARAFGINAFLYFIILTLLTLVFLVFFGMKAEGVLLASFITSVLFFVHSFISIFREFPFTIDRQHALSGLKYALPLVPHALSSWLINMVDRLVLNGISGAVSTGLYNVGFQLANVLNILTSAVNQAYVPWLFSKLTNTQSEDKQKVQYFIQGTLWFYGVLVIGFTSFSKAAIVFFLNPNYLESWKVIPFLSLGVFFNGLYMLFIGPVFNVNSKVIPLVTFIGAIVSVGSNFLLIPLYGNLGSAISNMISNMSISIVATILGIKYSKISLRWSKPYIGAAILTVAVICYFCLKQTDGYIDAFWFDVFFFLLASLLLSIFHGKEITYLLIRSRIFRIGKFPLKGPSDGIEK